MNDDNDVCEIRGLTEADIYGEPITGLADLFGHGLIPDDDGRPMINHQFKVLHRADERRYLVQMFSFVDGCPTNTEARTVDYLLGPECRLYRTESGWNAACEQELEARERAWRASLT